MPLGRVIAVWVLLMFVETLHGMAREVFIAPVLGDLHARQLGVFFGSVLILIITIATIRWMGTRTTRTQWQAGGLWVALTLAFEIGLGLWLGLGWHRILEDYDPTRGGLMLLGLALLLCAPWLAARIRRV